MLLTEKINARGHTNILSLHRSTFEITKEDHLTLQGDCIIAVSAERGLKEFSAEFLEALKNEKSRLDIKMVCGGIEENVVACGHPELSFTSTHEMVVRKSSFVCARTLAIRADKSAKELSRDFIAKLKEGNPVYIELTVSC